MSDTRITSNFDAQSTAEEVAAWHDLSGRKMIVTGAGSGLGRETARVLAARGAEVVMAVRNPSAIEDDAATIGATADRLDLADVESIRDFAARHSKAPLHVLINNAGVMATPLRHLPNGHEQQIGINHFGHALLTQLLGIALEAGAPARVVQLTSLAHVYSAIDFDDIDYKARAYDKWQAYGQSKTANALYPIALTKHWAYRGITANAVMPGGIMTSLQRELSMEEMRGLGWFDEAGNPHPMFKTVEQGAATSVWAATGNELDGLGGLYLEDCAEAEPWSEDAPFRGVAAHARDEDAAERLWKCSKR